MPWVLGVAHDLFEQCVREPVVTLALVDVDRYLAPAPIDPIAGDVSDDLSFAVERDDSQVIHPVRVCGPACHRLEIGRRRDETQPG